jgi:hypothetical protein
MPFYDLRPPVANLRDLADLGQEFAVIVVEAPAPAAVELEKIIAALLREVTPFLCDLAEFAKCRAIDHGSAGAGRRLAAQGHDEWVQSTSTDASLYETCELATF